MRRGAAVAVSALVMSVAAVVGSSAAQAYDAVIDPANCAFAREGVCIVGDLASTDPWALPAGSQVTVKMPAAWPTGARIDGRLTFTGEGTMKPSGPWFSAPTGFWPVIIGATGIVEVADGGTIELSADSYNAGSIALVTGTVNTSGSVINAGMIDLGTGSLNIGGTLTNAGLIVHCGADSVVGTVVNIEFGVVREHCPPPPGAPPVVTPTLAGTAGAAGWYTSDVTVTWSTAGSTPAVTSAPCASTVVSTDTTGQDVTCTATSAGGTTTRSVTVKRDVTPPAISWGSGAPADGQTYVAGALPPSISCTATDATAGVAAAGCQVSGYSTLIGTHTVTASAADNAGNTAMAHRTYIVEEAPPAWTFRGFYSAVVMGPTATVVKGGANVPLKFEAFVGATEVTDPRLISLAVTPTSCTPGGSTLAKPAQPGSISLKYDTKGGQFMASWKPPKTPGACYTVSVAGGGSTLQAVFRIA